MKVLVIGASGMIGSTVLRVLSEKKDWDVFGSVRDQRVMRFFTPKVAEHLLFGVDVENSDSLIRVLDSIRQEIVINCAGITKHKSLAEDPLAFVPINTLMPHKLAGLCKLADARLIHISSDCVFSGNKGNYTEDDFPDALDMYGKSKALGEVDYPHAITLRTSTIGHEIQTKFGLLDWFLSQHDSCLGYAKAFFSGMPTVVLAQIIRDIVIPRPDLAGLYHISSDRVSKYDLLKLIAEAYDKKIDIFPDETFKIDRSLDSSRFNVATGYVAPKWPELIKIMHAFK
jgi:dTDP-4-dehydrorhamnose reductase